MSSYGCFNREPLADMLPMPSQYTMDTGTHKVICAETVHIPNVFAKDCRYTLTELGKADKGCIGCRWRKEL